MNELTVLVLIAGAASAARGFLALLDKMEH